MPVLVQEQICTRVMPVPAVTIRKLSIRTDNLRILDNLDFDLADRTLTALVGPMGSGKSTLLAFLAGEAGAKGLRVNFEQASYNTASRSQATGLCIIHQKPRTQKRNISAEMLKSRLVELLEVCQANSAPLCIDEPTAGLETEDGAIMMRTLREIAASRAVLIVTHKLDEVRTHCEHVIMINNGKLVASLPTEQFFAHDAHEHIRHFVKTGGLDTPRDDTPIQHLAPDIRTTPEGFDLGPVSPISEETSWILPKKFGLCNTDMPDENTGGLHIILETSAITFRSFAKKENRRQSWDTVDQRPDRSAAEIAKICRLIENQISNGDQVTIHTRGNPPLAAAIIGAFLIMNGFSPVSALDVVGKKLPELHLGMRLEQLLWDVDLIFSIS